MRNVRVFINFYFTGYGTISVELANQTKPGVIVYVKSPKDFYIQLLDFQDVLQTMQDMLQSRYNRLKSTGIVITCCGIIGIDVCHF